MTRKVLLIEDDPELGSQIVGTLHKAGFVPTWWRRGDPVLGGDVPEVAVIVLDLMLPGAHGFDVLKALRRTSDLPVLVLSARIDTHDKVRALQLGADDYMTKPFWPEELVERVRARLRRPNLVVADVVEVGDLRLDLGARTATLDGAELDLTPVEWGLLAELARRPGAAITREHLATRVLDPERGGTARTLDVHVARLRKKLGPSERIETVWGVGYRWLAKDDG